MNYLKVLLLGVLNTENEDSINYQIAEFLLQNIDHLNDYSATKIAESCNVSKAAVSRFCRQIGLEDFIELQIIYRAFQRPASRKFHYRGEQTTGDPIDDFLSASENVIRELRTFIDRDDLDELVEDISRYKKVAAFGHMQSGNIAFTLQHDLTDAGKYIYVSHRYHRQKEYIQNASDDTLIILFSAAGNFLERMFVSDSKLRMKTRKPKIYLITAQEKEKADYVHKVIQLSDRYDYSTSVLALSQYVSLISLLYHERYDVSRFKN